MTIAEFRQELIDKRSYFYQFTWPATTYGHWSAGRYFTTFNLTCKKSPPSIGGEMNCGFFCGFDALRKTIAL